MDDQFITPSEVIEYMFCPRFVYFMNVLGIDQHEHRRHLVSKGRDIHNLKLVQNKEYLRTKIGVKDKLLDAYLSSPSLHLVGKIDEVLFLNDGTAAPLDYKYAFWENKIYNTHRIQQCLYALLIEENFNVVSQKAFLVYVRSKNHLEEFAISQAMKKKALDILDDIFKIITIGSFPNVQTSTRKCEDCTYRNICVS
jgi:CRISPR-associated exonuclease Cas4